MSFEEYFELRDKEEAHFPQRLVACDNCRTRKRVGSGRRGKAREFGDDGLTHILAIFSFIFPCPTSIRINSFLLQSSKFLYSRCSLRSVYSAARAANPEPSAWPANASAPLVSTKAKARSLLAQDAQAVALAPRAPTRRPCPPAKPDLTQTKECNLPSRNTPTPSPPDPRPPIHLLGALDCPRTNRCWTKTWPDEWKKPRVVWGGLTTRTTDRMDTTTTRMLLLRRRKLKRTIDKGLCPPSLPRSLRQSTHNASNLHHHNKCRCRCKCK